jgi:hypothetical protein
MFEAELYSNSKVVSKVLGETLPILYTNINRASNNETTHIIFYKVKEDGTKELIGSR